MTAVLEWLLDADPSIRWQVLRDLAGESADVVAAERARVATEGWGLRLLALQAPDGQWGGGDYSPKWVSTTYTLLLLRHLGIDPRAERARTAIERVRPRVLGAARHPFFTYHGETCITGLVLALGAYFGERHDEVVDWLLSEQVEEGGWNCQTVRGSRRASFDTTISVLEGLLEYEHLHGGNVAEVRAARARAQEYLLERRLFRSLRTGAVVNPKWTRFSFPPRWHYDVLRGLDYLRAAGVTPDARMDEALALVERKRSKDGRWPLQNHHPGREHFAMEAGPRKPSRWNTLRAMRVLRWAGRD
jgi:hypothetical protein